MRKLNNWLNLVELKDFEVVETKKDGYTYTVRKIAPLEYILLIWADGADFPASELTFIGAADLFRQMTSIAHQYDWHIKPWDA